MDSPIAKIILVLLLLLVLGACAGSAGQPELASTVAVLGTQVAQQQEWLSYQSTQIGRQGEVISYLATRMPAGQTGGLPQSATITLTPFQPLSGSIVIHQGSCCAGGQAGSLIDLDVQFEAFSANGEVLEMRVLSGVPSADEKDMELVPWEPFAYEKIFQLSLPTNWTTFWVHVQFRDETGLVSPIYSDEIALEGM
jgi:hypothetical protein